MQTCGESQLERQPRPDDAAYHVLKHLVRNPCSAVPFFAWAIATHMAVVASASGGKRNYLLQQRLMLPPIQITTRWVAARGLPQSKSFARPFADPAIRTASTKAQTGQAPLSIFPCLAT